MRPISGFTSAAALLSLFSAATAAQTTLQEQTLVTATRQSVDGSTLPMSWVRVDQDAIAFAGSVHINEIMQQVPGAWISRGNGQESLTALRSPVLTGGGSCGSFLVAADSISLRAPGFCNVNQLFDANTEQAGSIEVLKGPATALYGSNTLHGLINVLSAAPSETLDHALSLEAGPYDYYRAKYQISDTIGANGFSLRLNGTTDGGYKDDSGFDQQKGTLRHDYAGERINTRTVLDFANLNQETAGFIQGYKSYQDAALKKTNPNPEAFRDAWSVRLYSDIELTLNNHNQLTFTPFFRDNDMTFLQHFVPWQPLEETGHKSAGLRTTLQTSGNNYEWTNGIDLEVTDGWLKEVQAIDFSPNQPKGIHYDYQVDATVGALYSQLAYTLSPRLDAHLGLRSEHTRYDYDNRTTDGSACAPTASACRFYRPADRRDEFNDWSLNAGISYALGDDHVGYARAANGYRAPQTTELYRLQSGQTVAELDSEKIGSFELGLRGDALATLAYDIAVYRMDKEDVIFQDADRQNVSGAKTRHIGLDVSLHYALSENWSASVTGNYAKHTYDSHISLLGADTDIKGNDIDTAPRMFGSARLRWNFSDWVGRASRAELEWVHMDDYYLEPDNLYQYSGHDLLNLRISSQLSPRLGATLRITNLTDEDYAERADYGFGEYRYFVGQPTGAYLEFNYQFGDS